MKSYFIITVLIYSCKDKHSQEYFPKLLPLSTFYNEYKSHGEKLLCGVFHLKMKIMDTELIYQATSNFLQ